VERFAEDYTTKTKIWLDQRFKMTDEEGIYLTHQNAYGLRDRHIEDHRVLRYTITFQLMKSLSHLEFETLLDVGGAEGYTAALVQKILTNLQKFICYTKVLYNFFVSMWLMVTENIFQNLIMDKERLRKMGENALCLARYDATQKISERITKCLVN